MNTIKFSYDRQSFQSKPSSDEIRRINNRIARSVQKLDRLNMRRLLAKSEKNLDGKIFTEFVALILISHLDHKMEETNLYKTYSMQQLLDKLDVLECFEDENRKLRIGELLSKQTEIYETLGVALPTSSC